MKRPTITDIAREAGVSKGAVSYALNGKPGVSEATRHRIAEIARELGWSPSSTARALSGGRAGAIGLALGRTDVLGAEPFLAALLEGVERELLLQVVPGAEAELALYRHWRGERRVDGVLLAGPECADELPRIGLPAVLLGGPPGHLEVPSVWIDDAAAAGEVLEYLTALGHRRIARIAGPAVFAHARGEAVAAAAGRFDSVVVQTIRTGPPSEPGGGRGVPEGRAWQAGASGTGFGGAVRDSGQVAGSGREFDPPFGRTWQAEEPGKGFGGSPGRTGPERVLGRESVARGREGAISGLAAETGSVHRVLTGPNPPTALLCDTDLLAVAALAAARDLGLAVPGELSVVSWDDSELCRVARPALSAIRRPLAELGGLAAAMLRDLIAGDEVGDVCASRPRLITRSSTGPVR